MSERHEDARPGRSWMWIPFALSVGLALFGLVANVVIVFASPSSKHDYAYAVAQRRPMSIDPKENGSSDVVVATQTYVEKKWWSQVTAFDAEGGGIAWQSEGVDVPYARGFRVCRFGSLVVLSDEKGNVSALRAIDGRVAWRASVGGEVASCCATESVLVSGQPGDLVLTVVDGTSFVVDSNGARRTARPASCGALPSDCRTCPGQGMSQGGVEDRFLVRGAYVTRSYWVSDQPESRLLFGSADSGSAALHFNEPGKSNGYESNESLVLFVPAFASALVVGWLVQRRNLEDGIVAQLAANVTGVLLGGLLRIG